MKVLVVSSSNPTRESLCASLAAHGLTSSFADGGQEALEQVTLEDAPQAVLMDARSSALDALTVLKRLRAEDARTHVPVLLIFDEADRAERLLALKLGADDVLQAPWDDEEIPARIQRSLALKRRLDHLVAEGQKLELLSVTDGLTAVNNHRFFRERLAEEFRRAQRYDDPLALILVDLDHFKEVNDLYGHLVGDEVLKAVAQAIRESLRETDLLARYGGEEFAVLLPQTHLSGSLTVAERIRRDIQALKLGEQGAIHVTASLGIAGFPSPIVASAEQLIGAADEALYRAKHEGRNRICLSPVAPAPQARQATHTS